MKMMSKPRLLLSKVIQAVKIIRKKSPLISNRKHFYFVFFSQDIEDVFVFCFFLVKHCVKGGGQRSSEPRRGQCAGAAGRGQQSE